MKSLFEQILNDILSEQESSEQTFTAEQQKFLGKFAQKNSDSLGILYSKTPAGIEEFILRSGTALDLTPETFDQLIQAGVISLQPYGTRRDTDYTVHLEIPLDTVAGFAQQDAGATTDAEAAPMPASPSGGGGGGGGMTTADLEVGTETPEEPAAETPEEPGAETPEVPGAETPEAPEEEIPTTGPEESFRKDGDLIVEHAGLDIYSYQSILEQTSKTLQQILSDKNRPTRVYSSKSRVLNRLPSGYVYYLEKIIELMSKRLKTDLEKEHLVADLMDNLAYNFGLTPYQILRSYVYYKNQNKLRNILKK